MGAPLRPGAGATSSPTTWDDERVAIVGYRQHLQGIRPKTSARAFCCPRYSVITRSKGLRPSAYNGSRQQAVESGWGNG
jgi:hypothetical protein